MKRTIVICLTMLLCVSIVGCGSSNQEEVPKDHPQQENDKQVFEEMKDLEPLEIYQSVLDRIAKEVHYVKLEEVSDSAGYHQDNTREYVMSGGIGLKHTANATTTLEQGTQKIYIAVDDEGSKYLINTCDASGNIIKSERHDDPSAKAGYPFEAFDFVTQENVNQMGNEATYKLLKDNSKEEKDGKLIIHFNWVVVSSGVEGSPEDCTITIDKRGYIENIVRNSVINGEEYQMTQKFTDYNAKDNLDTEIEELKKVIEDNTKA